MRFSDEYLTEVRDRNAIEAVVANYVNLRSNGRMLSGLCPFHNEKTPSFYIYLDTQSFYCFGCGAGGDVVTFVRLIENIDYSEAVVTLAERSGMALPIDGYDDGVAKLRRRILEANREAGKFFYKSLYSQEGETALDYFHSRQLSDSTIRHFGLGFAPDKWDSLYKYLRSKGFSDSELIASDLAKKSKNGNLIDVYRNRVMFPIIDLRGSVIAFGGRVLDDSKPKYINTSDTLVYKKSQGVFALNFAKRGTDRTLILCEGYMDVIAYHQAGFTNAVAGLGTAFTHEQAKLLSKYCDEIILSYDSDEAGIKAVKKAIGILSSTPVKIRVARLEGGKDPDEIIKSHGKERMRLILESSVSDVEFNISSAAKNADKSTEEGRLEYLNNAVEVLAGYGNKMQVDIYASKLAAETGVSKEAILIQISKQKRKKEKNENNQAFNNAKAVARGKADSVNTERGYNLRAAIAEETIISSLLANPDFSRLIKERLCDEDFATKLNLRIIKLLIDRIEQGRGIELTLLSGDLSSEEMGYLAMLEAKRTVLSNTEKEIIDCITVLKDERKNRKTVNPATLSDEEFLKLFHKDD